MTRSSVWLQRCVGAWTCWIMLNDASIRQQLSRRGLYCAPRQWWYNRPAWRAADMRPRWSYAMSWIQQTTREWSDIRPAGSNVTSPSSGHCAGVMTRSSVWPQRCVGVWTCWIMLNDDSRSARRPSAVLFESTCMLKSPPTTTGTTYFPGRPLALSLVLHRSACQRLPTLVDIHSWWWLVASPSSCSHRYTRRSCIPAFASAYFSLFSLLFSPLFFNTTIRIYYFFWRLGRWVTLVQNVPQKMSKGPW